MTNAMACPRARLILSVTLVASGLACAHAPSAETEADRTAAQTSDSSRTAQAERSRSSASQVVEFDDAERKKFARVELMIQAHFSGVTVVPQGGSYTIKIRGAGSFGSGNDPLVIIDGASRSAGDLRSVSPLEVIRIEIMKDAAASFYGSRGANGVIVITTRRGGR